MRRILILWHILIPIFIGTPLWLSAQNCGLEDTLAIPVNRTVNYDIEITDVINNDLSDPNQGVCGIEINFEHRFVENLELSITSPSGQRIQLIGPNTTDQLAFTFGAVWNINFVPCAATAQPDSGYVAKWNNNQPNNFISGGRYKGSYYPFMGCLEDFNTGPVNGTWKLTVTNNPSTYIGRIFNFRLIFCDSRGIICCEADAGSLAAFSDEQWCEGSDSLKLDLKPSFPVSLKPDTVDYGYTYMISQEGVLLEYDSLADLRDLPVGNYQVCGLSYRRSDLDSFPQPDGVLRLDDFRKRLNGDSLLYCGRITNNCVDVRITAGDTALVQRDICLGESVQIGNQTFTNDGDYFVTLPGSGGCDSTVHLRLAVVPGIVTNLDREICAGDSVQVGNSVYKTTGIYADTLAMPSGCDSIVNLNLRVNDIPPTFLTAVICQGDSYSAGNQTFTTTGQYDITLSSATGCDSLISVTLLVLEPNAQIAPPDTLGCNNPTLTLNGSGSTPTGELTYLWTNMTGDTLGVDSTLQVDSAEAYILTVFQTVADFSCTSSDTVQVTSSAEVPIADAGSAFEINCANPSVTIGGANTSVGPNYTYRWRIINGNIVGDTTQQTAMVDASGTYQLIVTNTTSGCADTASTVVTANFTPPFAEIQAKDTLSCEQTSVRLEIGNSTRGDSIRYVWRDSLNNIIGTDSTQEINTPGKYVLEVLNTTNGCLARDSIDIESTIGLTTITFGNTVIPCNVDTFQLTASVSPMNANYAFAWTGVGVLGSSDSLATLIDRPGEYILTVVNLDNNCILNEFVEVTKETRCELCVEVNLPDPLTCLQDTLQLTATICEPCNNCTVQWTTTDGNIVTNPDSLVILINQPGTYTITIRNPNGDFKSIDLEVPQIVDFPIADAGADQEISCTVPAVSLGGNNTSSGANFSYQWTGLNGGVVSQPNDSITQTLEPDTYILQVLNTQTGCTAMDTVMVVENSFRPVANAGVDTSLNCGQDSLTLNGSSTPNARYAWTTQGGNILSGADTPNPVVGAAGIYILTITDLSTNCTAQDTVMVTPGENSPQVPTFADEFLTCNNPSITLDASSFVLDSLTARWCQLDSNNNVINCIDNALLIATQAGLYRFELTDTTSGCRSTAMVRIIDNQALPMVAIGAADTLNCVQPSIVLNPTVNPAAGDYQYRWSAANGSIILNDSSRMLTVTAPDIYILEVTNRANGCVATDSIEILQNADMPSAFAGFDTLLTCNLTSVTLLGTAIGNNLLYEWTTTTGNIVSGGNTLMPIVNEPGTYFLNVTNQLSSCTAQDTVVVGQNTMPPMAAVLNSDSLNLDCTLNSLTLDGSFSVSQTGRALMYNWSAANGIPITNPNDSIIQVSAAGQYQLLVEDMLNGCRDSLTVTVNQDTKLPELLIPTPQAITCTRDSVLLQAQLSSGNPNFSVRWINPAGQVLNEAGLNITVRQSGNYILEVTSSDNGCMDSILINVPIDTIKPTISIAPPNELGCQVQTTQLVATASGGTNVSYNWTTQGGSITTGANTNTATVDAGGVYTVLVTNTINGCTNEASATVIEGESSIQQAFFTITPANCIRQGSGFIQVDLVSGGSGPYLYSLGEFPFANDDYFQDLRAGEYTLRVQDMNGCEWETQVLVPAPEPITVELVADTLINFGDTISLLGITDLNRVDSIQWFVNGDTISFANTIDVTVAPPLSAQYRILVTASNGCTATDLVNVAVTNVISVFIPNAFTPDGNGINDVFMIYAGENVKQVKVFAIFDRWGNRLFQEGPFQPNDPTFGWDGNFNNQPMDAGVYVFFAEVELVDGRTEIVKGDVTLLR